MITYDYHKVLTNDDKVVAFNFQNIDTAHNQYIDEYSPCTLFPEYHEFSAQTYAVGGNLKISGSAYVYDKKPNEVVNLTLTPSSNYVFDHYEISSNCPKRGPLSGALNGNQYTFGYGDAKISAFFKYDYQTAKMLYLTEFDNVVNGVDTPITSKVGSTYNLKSACDITTMKISDVDNSYQTSLNKNYGDKNCIQVSFISTSYLDLLTTNLFPVGSSKSSNYTVSYWFKDDGIGFNIPGNILTEHYYNYNPYYFFELWYRYNYGQGYEDYGLFLCNNSASQTAYNGAAVETASNFYGIRIPRTSVKNYAYNNWNYFSIEVEKNNIYRYYINGVKYAQLSGNLNPNIINPFRIYGYNNGQTSVSCYMSEYCVQSGFHGDVVPDTPIV